MVRELLPNTTPRQKLALGRYCPGTNNLWQQYGCPFIFLENQIIESCFFFVFRCGHQNFLSSFNYRFAFHYLKLSLSVTHATGEKIFYLKLNDDFISHCFDETLRIPNSFRSTKSTLVIFPFFLKTNCCFDTLCGVNGH